MKDVKKSAWGWLESIVLTVAGLGASFYLNPSDPFFFHSAFPWIWFVPVLTALRYGIGPSVLSVFIITATFVFNESAQALGENYHRLYLLSGCILTLICAEFSTVWSGRIRRAEQAAYYAEHRLNQMIHAYHVISQSHTHLEQSLIAEPVTLRSAVQACIELLKESDGELTPSFAQRFIELLAFYCNIEQCGLYLMNSSGLSQEPIAVLGLMGRLEPQDPLVQACQSQQQTSYYAANELTDPNNSRYLVCAPVFNREAGLQGVLVIEMMPFLALNHDNLQFLSILLGYYSNQQWSLKKGVEILQRYPDCPLEFAAQLSQLSELVGTTQIKSSLVGICIKHWQQRNDFILALEAQRRGLDLIWVHQSGEMSIVFVLMPFSAEAAILGYRNRIEGWLEDSYGVDLLKGPIRIYSEFLNADSAVQKIDVIVEYAHAG